MESIRYVLLDPKISVNKDGVKKYAKRRVHGATFDKARELCRTFSDSNILDGDGTQTKIKSAVKLLDKTLDGVTTEHLRNSEIVRERVGNEVKNIMSKFDF